MRRSKKLKLLQKALATRAHLETRRLLAGLPSRQPTLADSLKAARNAQLKHSLLVQRQS